MSATNGKALPPAVVLGLGQNGLATIRALARMGVPVIGIDNDLEQPGAHTRYARKSHCPGFSTEGPELADHLMRLGADLGQKAVLFPSGDINLTVVSENRERLAAHFHIVLPSREVLRRILDKKVFYRFAQENDLPIADTWFVNDAADIRRLAGTVRYPSLIKPYQPNAAWRRAFDTRLFIANSAEQLVRLYDRLAAVHTDLLLQEYIPGGDGDLCWGVTYLTRDGEPVALWTGRKLRQYPRGFGTATLAESRWLPDVADETLRALRALGHTGYGVVEFKRDARDGVLRITEVTGGRTWFPHGLVTRSGPPLHLVLRRARPAAAAPGTGERLRRGPALDSRGARSEDGRALLPRPGWLRAPAVDRVVSRPADLRLRGLGRSRSGARGSAARAGSRGESGAAAHLRTAADWHAADELLGPRHAACEPITREAIR